MKRNVVNILDVDELLLGFLSRYEGHKKSISDKQLNEFVNGNIRNYILRKAPISRDYTFWLNQKNYMEREIFNKSSGPYHRVDLQDIFFRVQFVLDFVCYSDYALKKNIKNLSFEDAEKKHEFWIKKRKKTFTEGSIKGVYSYKDGWKVFELKDKTAYERESSVMNNCVNSYFNNSSNKVYSLRNKDGKSIVTMEVDLNKKIINQFLMSSNRVVSKEVSVYLNEFAKNNGLMFLTTKRNSRYKLKGFLSVTSFVVWQTVFLILRNDLTNLRLLGKIFLGVSLVGIVLSVWSMLYYFIFQPVSEQYSAPSLVEKI